MRKGIIPFAALLMLAAPAAVLAGEENPDPPDEGLVYSDISDFREAAPAPPAPRAALKASNNGIVSLAGRSGALSGKVIYINGGHGWTANTNGTWFTQRSDYYELVEDLGNVDQLRFMAEELLRAGATVVPFRPVGHQLNEVVLDNDDAGVEFVPEDAWAASTASEYFGDPGDAVHYRYASRDNTQSAYARYRPNLPEAGFYPVYCWTRDGADRVNDQLYEIHHTGGVTAVRINHRMVGKGWIYLGEYYFDQGTEGFVLISNQSMDSSGSYVFADAIRFGNGMGDVDRGAGVSGRSREDEASRYWVQRGIGQGASSSIYDQSSLNDQDDNVSTPTRMTAWMNREAEGDIYDRLFLSFHSNAYDPGSLGLYNGNNEGASAATPNQQRWAEIVAREVNNDLVAIGSPPFESPWPDRVARGLSLTLDRTDIEFGEIRGDRINDEMDATIIEVAAHGNQNESLLMQDMKVRKAIARASLQAMIKYFVEFDGMAAVFPPATPVNVSAAVQQNGDVVVSWMPPPANEIQGSAAQGYRIYQSVNGYGFGNPIEVPDANALSHSIAGLPTEVQYLRVAAVNAAGESEPGEVLAVRRGFGRSAALIVNGFDRVDRFQAYKQPESGIGLDTNGTVNRVIERRINSRDYVVQHASALAAHGVSLDSASNEAVASGEIDLDDYKAVFWILGEESTADITLGATERSMLTSYLNQGGNLFISGTEIGWNLDQGGVDPTFYNQRLRADFASDDAGVYTAAGAAGSIFDGVSFNFAPGMGYDADYPDVINTSNGSSAAAVYSGQNLAAVQYEGGTPLRRNVTFGFPFETISDPAVRAEAMLRVVDFFALDAPAGIPGDDADRDCIPDSEESDTGTNRLVRDTDGDGFEDGVEVAIGTDPTDNASPADRTDVDDDGIPDEFDQDITAADSDKDGFLDFYEVAWGSDPTDPSSFPPLGDPDANGQTDNVDVVRVLEGFLGLSDDHFSDPIPYDVNRDGFVDNVDAVIILNFFTGNIPSLPLDR